jgi:hypothetical protein
MSPLFPVAGTSPYVVTTDDGTMFHCQPHEMSGETSDAPGEGDDGRSARWIFIDTKRVPHVGPVYDGQVAPQTLQRLLTEWWRQARC